MLAWVIVETFYKRHYFNIKWTFPIMCQKYYLLNFNMYFCSLFETRSTILTPISQGWQRSLITQIHSNCGSGLTFYDVKFVITFLSSLERRFKKPTTKNKWSLSQPRTKWWQRTLRFFYTSTGQDDLKATPKFFSHQAAYCMPNLAKIWQPLVVPQNPQF